MAEYQVVLTRAARKELEKFPQSVIERVLPRLREFKIDPRPRGTTKLEGEVNLYRNRVGEYRILYSIDDKWRIVDVLHIRHRNDIYKMLD